MNQVGSEDMPQPMDAMNIRGAKDMDFTRLTSISFQAKAHWPYPKDYFRIWEAELTITPDYIRKNIVFLAEVGGEIIGYYSLTRPDGQALLASDECYLDHIYVLPEYIGRNIGTSLFKHARGVAKQNGFRGMVAFVDPHAKGFYEKMKADFLYDAPSNIPGRKIPVFRIDCE